MIFRQGLMLLAGSLCLMALAERIGCLLQQHWLIVTIDAHGQMLLLIASSAPVKPEDSFVLYWAMA